MLGNRCDTFLQTCYIERGIINGFVVLVTILDTRFVPEAPDTFFSAPNGPHWRLNDAHWPTIPRGQTHNVVALLRLEFGIRDCGAPLFERDHVGPASADRREGSGGI